MKSKKQTPKRKVTTSHEEVDAMQIMSGINILMSNLPNVSSHPTFPEMVLQMARENKLIKLPPWFFQPICCRKSQAALSTTEQQRYICAFNMINADGTLGQLVTLHQACICSTVIYTYCHGIAYFYYFLKRHCTVIILMCVYLIGTGRTPTNRTFHHG